MKKVIVGISGGVDSSVAAYLLKEQGYHVECVFMKNWDQSLNNDVLGNPGVNDDVCTEERDYNDAKKVCDHLGLKIHRVDFAQEYWDKVFKYFLEEYKKGRTPNPDLFCNKYIKFGDLLEYVEKNFGDDWYLATGHYCDIDHNEEPRLLIAKDDNKDQTYFLSQVTSKQFEKVLFPLGKLEKLEVRKIAEEQGLVTATKKDSTGICFIGERDFKQFLQNYIPAKEGKVYDINTLKEVGKHKGIMYYTIGQNRGLGLSGQEQKYFVCGKDVEQNILFVSGSKEKDELKSDSCSITDVNIITPSKLTGTIKCKAKFRYRQDYNEVTYDVENNIIHFNELIVGVTPGQAAVLYLDNECIAGAIINDVYLKGKKQIYYNNLV